MPAYFNLVDKAKRYFWFSGKEARWLLMAIFALTLMAAFDDGSKTFQIENWLANFAIVLLIVALAVFVHEAAHRLYALHIGFQLEFKPWFYGLVAGIIMMLLTFGKFFFLAYGSFEAKLLRTHRLGYFRYGINYFALAAIAAAGPVANVMLAAIFRLMAFLPEGLVEKAVIINIMFAIYNMLPIPPLDGAQIFFGGRIFYAFISGLVLGWSIFLLIPGFNLIIALIGSLILSAICGTAMLLFEEKIIG